MLRGVAIRGTFADFSAVVAGTPCAFKLNSVNDSPGVFFSDKFVMDGANEGHEAVSTLETL